MKHRRISVFLADWMVQDVERAIISVHLLW